MRGKKFSIRFWLGKLHLWLGLTSGTVFFIVSITGCLYAFQSEIQDALQEYRFVTPEQKPWAPPSKLRAAAEAVLPGKQLHAILYTRPDRAAQAIFFSFDPEYYYIAYLNPYTAEVLKVKDMERDFFQWILDGHFYLWLPPAIGQPVVASFTLVFVAMLLTGIALWWPRRKKHTAQRFKMKWTGRWRRKNYSLHTVMGFYVFLAALLLSMTGLVWGFQWFANTVYHAAGGEKSLLYTDPLSDTTRSYDGAHPPIDEVYYRMLKEYPAAESIEVHIPPTPEVAIAASANPDTETYWKIDYRYYDQNTLSEVSVKHLYGRFPSARAADKLLRMNYDIHTGAIMGLPGKILAFLAGLTCASLPVTGTVMWLGRRRKCRRIDYRES